MLFDTVQMQPVNIDSIESRLFAIREKLIKEEENPVLLKLGYKPFIPPNSPSLNDSSLNNSWATSSFSHADSTNSTTISEGTRLSFLSPTNDSFKSLKHSKDPRFSLSKKSTASTAPLAFTVLQPQTSQTPSTRRYSSTVLAKNPVITDKKMADCVKKLERWNTAGVGGDKLVESPPKLSAIDGVPRNTTFVKLPLLFSTKKMTKKVNTPVEFTNNRSSRQCQSSLGSSPNAISTGKESSSKFIRDSNRRKTFTKDVPLDFNESSKDYDTVEFTPGMTSKVPRHC